MGFRVHISIVIVQTQWPIAGKDSRPTLMMVAKSARAGLSFLVTDMYIPRYKLAPAFLRLHYEEYIHLHSIETFHNRVFHS